MATPWPGPPRHAADTTFEGRDCFPRSGSKVAAKCPRFRSAAARWKTRTEASAVKRWDPGDRIESIKATAGFEVQTKKASVKGQQVASISYCLQLQD